MGKVTFHTDSPPLLLLGAKSFCRQDFNASGRHVESVVRQAEPDYDTSGGEYDLVEYAVKKFAPHLEQNDVLKAVSRRYGGLFATYRWQVVRRWCSQILF